ncbi:MAG TPA: hypothetical protein VIF10_13960 [Methylobacter sp.]|jgi:hypothetical protein
MTQKAKVNTVATLPYARPSASPLGKHSAKERLNDQIGMIPQLQRESSEFKKWLRDTEVVIERLFGSDTRHLCDFKKVSYSPSSYNMYNPEPAMTQAFYNGLNDYKAVLSSMVDEIEECWSEDQNDKTPTNVLSKIEHLCDRFHIVAHQLTSRYDNRWTIKINDEYDVQDLLHAMLKIDFNDVRTEECTPSFAGKSSRMDFILKDHQIAIETKMTRQNLGVKELGDQLIQDIFHYQSHQDCKRLICFIYDPKGFIKNHASLVTDLSKNHSGLEVQVIITPKGT